MITKDSLITLRNEFEIKEEELLDKNNIFIKEFESEIEAIFDRIVKPLIEIIITQKNNVMNRSAVIKFSGGEWVALQERVSDELHHEYGSCYDCWYMIIYKNILCMNIPKEKTLKKRIKSKVGVIALRNVVKRYCEKQGFRVDLHNENLILRWDD
jgi:hypothetical protein